MFLNLKNSQYIHYGSISHLSTCVNLDSSCNCLSQKIDAILKLQNMHISCSIS